MMQSTDKVFKELFNQTDSILIIDVHGKVLFYQDYNDQINMMRDEEAIGRSIFDLYPFFKREDFTVFKAMDKKQPILNEIQLFEVNGIPKKSLNSAYPLINETGVIGCMVLSVEIGENAQRKRHSRITSKYDFEDIITNNSTFLESFDTLRMIAKSSSNVLIYGETGTGKELIAHTIHANSPRRGKPFLIQNCAAIPDNLMESILFGSSKGSFTGAIDKSGLFEVANGGTLYLDEVNSLSLDLQGKLLRAIENNSIRRIGENEERDINVRILASTNENLAMMVKEGKFRKDLFYRLNVTNYSIPSLRERRDDIPLLCEHYISQFNHRLSHNVDGLDDEVAAYFQAYPWDGNVRELKNVIEYACTIKLDGKITIHDLPSYMFNQRTMESIVSQEQVFSSTQLAVEAFIKPGTSLESQLEILEKEIMKTALLRNRYNITKTALELKLSRQTLYNKLKKYDLI
ncbi:MAG: sigma 54-interacting transcriptional regulator [Firmicutes bacterium]|nr:sigma 54-interacting transcriptional regulator [Bacillota bacterium]